MGCRISATVCNPGLHHFAISLFPAYAAFALAFVTEASWPTFIAATETECYYYDPRHFSEEYWMQKTTAWPALGFPAATQHGCFGEGALGLMGAYRCNEGPLEHAASYHPAQVVNVSQRGDADLPTDQGDLEPLQQVPLAQQDPSDARDRRGGRGRGPRIRFRKWQVQTLESVFQDTQYPDMITSHFHHQRGLQQSTTTLWFCVFTKNHIHPITIVCLHPGPCNHFITCFPSTCGCCHSSPSSASGLHVNASLSTDRCSPALSASKAAVNGPRKPTVTDVCSETAQEIAGGQRRGSQGDSKQQNGPPRKHIVERNMEFYHIPTHSDASKKRLMGDTEDWCSRTGTPQSHSFCILAQITGTKHLKESETDNTEKANYIQGASQQLAPPAALTQSGPERLENAGPSRPGQPASQRRSRPPQPLHRGLHQHDQVSRLAAARPRSTFYWTNVKQCNFLRSRGTSELSCRAVPAR
ncbi:PDZ and LIM domain protein 5 [Heterocephalus glaber]|uniref:PDZ and LIM domain protein 5 n=1 Tax=Heterocephalus glaber TaxID=10181 RepID=G5BF16_HETGA|nr:PDZ and LIM domain protein 5 [Heterocephalus glaber]